MDPFLSQVSLESTPEKAGSQTPPSSDTMNNPLTSHRLVVLPTEPTLVLLPDVAGGRNFKRQCKMANGFIPVLLTISAAFIATIPSPIDPDWVFLHAIDPALAFTSLLGSFCLVFYSFWSHPGPELAKVQGTVMGFSAALLVLAVLSRLALLFPCRLLLPMVALIMIMLIGLLFLLHYFTLLSTQNLRDMKTHTSVIPP